METTSVLVVGLRKDTSRELPATIDAMEGFRAVIEPDPSRAEFMVLSHQVGLLVVDAGIAGRQQGLDLIGHAGQLTPPLPVVVVGVDPADIGH